jgi:hypothetical protein
MKKNVLIFGLVMGVILCIPWIIMVIMLYNDPEFKSHDLFGYAILVVIYSLIFFGIRNYRNKELGGIISFGKAFKTGTLITVVSATVYVVVWMFCYYLIVPDFMEVFTKHILYQCTNDVELAAKTIEMKNFSKMFENPLFVILIAYAEVLPIGLVVSLISAFLLKKKQETVNLENQREEQ